MAISVYKFNQCRVMTYLDLYSFFDFQNWIYIKNRLHKNKNFISIKLKKCKKNIKKKKLHLK